jgi:hypothetical protein
VLLSFIGMRDPYNDADGTKGSLLSLCDQIRPDRIYLFPSKGEKSETESRAREAEKILTAKPPAPVVTIMPLEVTDATDFVQLSARFEDKISEVVAGLTEGRKILEDYEFHINCSSGTQQMAAIGYVLASAGRFPRIVRWQVKDPKYVAPNEPRVIKIEADIIGENTYIQRVKGNLKKFNFPSIFNDLKFLARIAAGERREKAETLSKVFDAYVLMDILRYKEAYAAIKEVSSPYWDAAPLNRQIATLKNLQNGGSKETPENLIDLFFNMERCRERGAFADVLSRFYRLEEGVLYYRVKNEHKVDPRDMWGSGNDPGKVEELKLKLRLEAKYSQERLGFERARKALEAWGDKEYLEVWDKIEELTRELTRTRNDAIVAHGMRPVSAKDARDALDVAKRLLTAFLPNGGPSIENYPFRPENIENIAKMLWEG